MKDVQDEEEIKLLYHNLRITTHGGGCCGRVHLWNFTSADRGKKSNRREALYRKLNNYVGSQYYSPGREICIEVVLNRGQKHYWHDVVTEVGFEEVKTWVNLNSGRACTMYIMTVEGDRHD